MDREREREALREALRRQAVGHEAQGNGYAMRRAMRAAGGAK